VLWCQGQGTAASCGIIDISKSEKGLLPLKGLRSLVFSTLFVFGVFVATALPQGSPQRVIIDTDPGTDDSMAILLALNSPELKVEAFTVVPGNVEAQQGLENALKIVSLAGRCDVLVAAGAQHPLTQKLITAQYWHGKNGLAGVELPPSKCKADHPVSPPVSASDHAHSRWAAHQHRTRPLQGSFDRSPGEQGGDHGWVGYGRQCRRCRGGEHL